MNIVILPGLDGTGLLLAGFADRLGGKYKTLVLSYPVNLVRYADLLLWTETHLPDDDFIIIAESFSGPIAIEIAALHPPKLKGVLFIATFASAPRYVPKLLTYLVYLAKLRFFPLWFFARPFVMGRWATSHHGRTFREVIKQVPAATLVERIHQVLNVNVREKISIIKVPFRYVAARSDWLVPSSAAGAFDQAGGEVISIEGPHFLLQANPDMAAEAAFKFISDIAQ
jgi:pimeloyl-[acyl-carrier protein] methyl ester esterase